MYPCTPHLLESHHPVFQFAFKPSFFKELILDVIPLHFFALRLCLRSLPGGTDDKESSCSVRDVGWIPGLGRSPGGGHGNPLQYSGLENSMDRGAWWATVHGAAKSQTGLSNFHFMSATTLKAHWNLEHA